MWVGVRGIELGKAFHYSWQVRSRLPAGARIALICIGKLIRADCASTSGSPRVVWDSMLLPPPRSRRRRHHPLRPQPVRVYCAWDARPREPGSSASALLLLSIIVLAVSLTVPWWGASLSGGGTSGTIGFVPGSS